MEDAYILAHRKYRNNQTKENLDAFDNYEDEYRITPREEIKRLADLKFNEAKNEWNKNYLSNLKRYGKWLYGDAKPKSPRTLPRLLKKMKDADEIYKMASKEYYGKIRESIMTHYNKEEKLRKVKELVREPLFDQGFEEEDDFYEFSTSNDNTGNHITITKGKLTFVDVMHLLGAIKYSDDRWLLAMHEIYLLNYPKTLDAYVERTVQAIENARMNARLKGKQIKVSIEVDEVLDRDYNSNEAHYKETVLFSHHSDDKGWNNRRVLTQSQNIKELVEKRFYEVEHHEKDNQLVGSGWNKVGYEKVKINIYRVNALKGSKWIKTPSDINNKGIINIHNDDDKCAGWSLLSGLNDITDNNKDRVNNYLQFLENKPKDNSTKEKQRASKNPIFPFKNMKFPMLLSDWTSFEKDNETLRPINVLLYEMSDDKPALTSGHISEKEGEPVYLILLNNEKTGENHYVCLKNLSIVFNKKDHAVVMCPKCLTVFEKRDEERYKTLSRHKELCYLLKGAKLELPIEEKAFIEYKPTTENKKTVLFPFIVISDLEACIDEKTKQHKTTTLCYLVSSKCENKLLTGVINTPKIFHQTSEYIEALYKDLLVCEKVMQQNEELKMTEEDKKDFNESKKCQKCKKEFKNKFDKHRDHDHQTGCYRGALCNKCNRCLRFTKPKFPVFFHNGKNYDFQLLMSELKGKIDKVIALNSTKYITFNYRNMKFCDSFLHIASSLDNLVKEHIKNKNTFPALEKYFKEDAYLFKRKGVMPYEWFDSVDKYKITEFPTIDKFNSTLYGLTERISEEDYNHGLNVFKIRKHKNMGEYIDDYNISDVCLTTDVLEKHRETSLKMFGLDIANFITLPSFAWSSMLKRTEAKIGLLKKGQEDLALRILEMKRGGMVVARKRYYKAEKGKSALLYVDANSLYPTAMCQPMPISDTKYAEIDSEQHTLEYWLNQKDDADVGAFLCVDIDIEKELHDKLKDNPLFAENKYGTPSTFMKKHFEHILKFKSEKLIADLTPKKSYLTHYRMVKLGMKLGYNIKLSPATRERPSVIIFKQEAFLKPYMEELFNLRKTTEDESIKNVSKLNMNSVYGKCVEDALNQIDVRIHLHNDNDEYDDETEKKIIKQQQMMNFNRKLKLRNRTVVQLNKTNFKLNKPLTLGVAVLEISKLIMFEFWYNVVQKCFENDELKPEFIYGDTDSIIMSIPTPDNQTLYDVLNSDKCRLIKEKLGKELGQFKDEEPPKDKETHSEMTEVIALRAKTYHYSTSTGKSKLKAKGVPSRLAKAIYNSNTYNDALNITPTGSVSFTKIGTDKDGLMKTLNCKRININAFDDKVYVCENGIDTLPHGHYKIKN